MLMHRGPHTPHNELNTYTHALGCHATPTHVTTTIDGPAILQIGRCSVLDVAIRARAQHHLASWAQCAFGWRQPRHGTTHHVPIARLYHAHALSNTAWQRSPAYKSRQHDRATPPRLYTASWMHGTMLHSTSQQRHMHHMHQRTAAGSTTCYRATRRSTDGKAAYPNRQGSSTP
jgi:hypothetical protein